MNPTLILALLACLLVCIEASPVPQPDENAETNKKPSVPGISTNTGFDEIVVESSLNVRNKSPEKRQSKLTRLVIPHMIPKKFSESPNSKYIHTEEPSEMPEASTSTSKPSTTAKETVKPPKSKKATTTTTTTTTTAATTTAADDDK